MQHAGDELSSVEWSDIKIVQNLIERCLQQFMTQTEIIAALQTQANIDPAFTCLVWQKLEEQNPEFFYSYGVRINVRDQIVAFNYLVDQQVLLMQRMSSVTAEFKAGAPAAIDTAAPVAAAVGQPDAAAAATAAADDTESVVVAGADLMKEPLMSPTPMRGNSHTAKPQAAAASGAQW